MKKKIFTMLVLLMTAVTGAWAQDQLLTEYTSNATLNNVTVSADMEIAIGDGAVVTINNGLTIAEGKTLTIVGPGELVVNGAAGSTGDEGTDDNGGPGGSGGAAISGAVAIYSGTITATGGAGGAGGYSTWCAGGNGGNGGYAFAGTLTYYGGTITATGGAGGAGGGYGFMSEGPAGSPGSPGQAFASNDAVTWENDPTSPDPKPTNLTQQSVTFSGPAYVDPNAEPEGIDLTFNADSTVASFDMPANDLTVNYELVRDMTQSMTVTVEDAQGKSSIRLKKTDNGKYQPADMTTQQMAGLITVTDDIEQQTLTNQTDYTVQIFAVNDNDQPTGTAIAFADLTPGRYVAFATAKEGTIYDGRTLPSNVFKLFVGYEVEVEAGQYATFYKDENLKLSEETENAELRTITSVQTDKAIVGGDFTIAPKLTPLLVHNTADVKQTILLIPTEEHPDEVQFASQFMGTLDGTTLEVASNTKTSYALNGTNFVWVKYQPLEVPANKCWLEVTNAAGVKAITLVDEDDATGINAIDNGQLTIDNDWYDLNGRKLQTPKQRGIYINNGKKVVVK